MPTRNIVLSRKFVIAVSIKAYYFQNLTTGTVIASTRRVCGSWGLEERKILSEIEWRDRAIDHGERRAATNRSRSVWCTACGHWPGHAREFEAIPGGVARILNAEEFFRRAGGC